MASGVVSNFRKRQSRDKGADSNKIPGLGRGLQEVRRRCMRQEMAYADGMAGVMATRMRGGNIIYNIGLPRSRGEKDRRPRVVAEHVEDTTSKRHKEARGRREPGTGDKKQETIRTRDMLIPKEERKRIITNRRTASIYTNELPCDYLPQQPCPSSRTISFLAWSLAC